MRLIDADKLLEPGYTDMFDEPIRFAMVSRQAIEAAPTVIAIPIQWIHDYLDYTFLPESHFWVIQKMIKEWDKEHEKDI